MRLEPALAVQKLADERLPGGEVAVGLDPAAAGRDEPPLGHRAAQPLPQLRVVALDPLVVLGRGAGEAELGILVQKPQLGRERSHGLAPGFGERPEPGGVQVRVPDRHELVHPGGVAVLVQALKDRGVELAAEPVQLVAELAHPGGVEPLLALGLERAQRLEVPVQPPRVGVEDADVAAPQLGVLVAGELDVKPRPGERRLLMMAVEAVQREPVPPERALAVGLPEEPEALAGCRRLDPEPPGRPARSEPLARAERSEVERLGLVPGDPIDRAGDEDPVDRADVAVDARTEQHRGLRQPLPAVTLMANHRRELTLAPARRDLDAGGAAATAGSARGHLSPGTKHALRRRQRRRRARGPTAAAPGSPDLRLGGRPPTVAAPVQVRCPGPGRVAHA